MINNLELNILTNGSLSLQAKIIYTIGIQPFTTDDNIVLNYSIYRQCLLITDVDKNKQLKATYNPDNNTINGFILELINVGLLIPKIDNSNKYYDNSEFYLPYRKPIKMQDSFRIYEMNTDWLPSPNFESTAQFAELEDTSYTGIELSNFILYWSNKKIFLDNHRWDLKFISYLKKSRQSKSFQQQ